MEPSEPVKEHSRRRVSYCYDSKFGSFEYAVDHYMRPLRVKMTHHLVHSYDLIGDITRPPPASHWDITKFHAEDYISFLQKEQPEPDEEDKYHIGGGDTPRFDGLFEFCALSCGGSLAAASLLNKKEFDIAINWMGGLHHAMKSRASGFCYTNDIVLGILELLKYHKRVLYVDIDVHHGDGVEAAFHDTDRVMTVSFHQYDPPGFFPGTGSLSTRGTGKGRNYAVNVPLMQGITDQDFGNIFPKVMTQVMERYQPEAVVLQCGADSLAGDLLGSFNMTLKGHGACVSFFRKYNIPLMLLGGGGYTTNNVARCWTYETALAAGMTLENDIPYNEYYEFFSPSRKLHLHAEKSKNYNSRGYLNSVVETVCERLREVNAPGVQMQPILRPYRRAVNLDFEPSPDVRISQALLDEMIRHPGEMYDVEEWSRNEENARAAEERPRE